MAIQKQEFYEGAALLRLLASVEKATVQYKHPMFVLGGALHVYVKYSTKGRSPWAFTFVETEQPVLENAAIQGRLIIGLVCGHDGIVALPFDEFRSIAPLDKATAHIGCFRRHREHYEVSGPAGVLPRKIPPSDWNRLLDRRK